jgi:S-adenosyl-L-methionine hydrolase (adenosine-forming)
MSIVTLTTDLGYRDHYLAIVKALLITKQPNLNIIDLSCEIKANNISDTAYILKNSLPYFPENTIHLVAIKFIVNKSELFNAIHVDNSRYLITRYKNQILISPDTGLFSLIDANFNEPVFQLYYEGKNKSHFFLKDIFIDATIHLLEGKPIEEIASLTLDYYRAEQFESYETENSLRGKGVYVDDFGNIITNISYQKFNDVSKNRQFEIKLPGKVLNKIYTTYDDVKYGSPLVLFNSFGLLEIAINGKSAFNMLCPKEIIKTFDFNLIIDFK